MQKKKEKKYSVSGEALLPSGKPVSFMFSSSAVSAASNEFLLLRHGLFQLSENHMVWSEFQAVVCASLNTVWKEICHGVSFFSCMQTVGLIFFFFFVLLDLHFFKVTSKGDGVQMQLRGGYYLILSLPVYFSQIFDETERTSVSQEQRLKCPEYPSTDTILSETYAKWTRTESGKYHGKKGR